VWTLFVVDDPDIPILKEAQAVYAKLALEATVSDKTIDLCLLPDLTFPFNGLPPQARVQHFSRFQVLTRGLP
jgi:hypothetical protein